MKEYIMIPRTWHTGILSTCGHSVWFVLTGYCDFYSLMLDTAWVITMLGLLMSHWQSLWHFGMSTPFGGLQVLGVQVEFLMCFLGFQNQLVSSADNNSSCDLIILWSLLCLCKGTRDFLVSIVHAVPHHIIGQHCENTPPYYPLEFKSRRCIPATRFPDVRVWHYTPNSSRHCTCMHKLSWQYLQYRYSCWIIRTSLRIQLIPLFIYEQNEQRSTIT